MDRSMIVRLGPVSDRQRERNSRFALSGNGPVRFG